MRSSSRNSSSSISADVSHSQNLPEDVVGDWRVSDRPRGMRDNRKILRPVGIRETLELKGGPTWDGSAVRPWRLNYAVVVMGQPQTSKGKDHGGMTQTGLNVREADLETVLPESVRALLTGRDGLTAQLRDALAAAGLPGFLPDLITDAAPGAPFVVSP